jgi:quercetin dioxygenase-like cupin family protein
MQTTSRSIAAAIMISATTLSACMTSDAQAPQEKPLATRADGPLAWGPCPPIFPKGCEIAVLHGDPAKPNADVFLRVPGGYEIPTHTHSSAERMILVAGQLRVQYKGSAATTLSPGQYAYGPSKLPHRANCLSAESCTLFIAFEGPVDAEASASLD